MEKYQNMRYICPNCFVHRGINEVLFRRNVMLNTPDMMMNRLLLQMNHKDMLSRASYAVADWRDYPQEYRFISQGIITRLKDYNGDVLEKRVCPSCHFPLINSMNMPFYLCSFDYNGIEFQKVKELAELIQKEYPERVKFVPCASNEVAYDQYHIDFNNGFEVRIPTGLGLINRTTGYSILERFTNGANVSVIWLSLVDEKMALQTLERFVDAIAESQFIQYRPVAFCIECDDEATCSMESLILKMENDTPKLLDRINLVFQGPKQILLWNQDSYLESCSKLLGWIGDLIYNKEQITTESTQEQVVIEESATVDESSQVVMEELATVDESSQVAMEEEATVDESSQVAMEEAATVDESSQGVLDD